MFFFFQADDGIRYYDVTGVQTCALPILVNGDCIFAATGVTSGSLLEGVKYLRDGRMTTESVVMRARSGTVRWIKGEHRAK